MFCFRDKGLLLSTLASVLLLAAPAASQEVSAGITGVVTDASGAVIAGAAVTATQAERNLTWTTKTNETGVYALPRIPAGVYDVSVEATGFRTAVSKGIRLEVNQRARLDIQMQLGQVTEVVEVTGAAPLLQTEKTEVGSVVNTTTTINLPLNGRNFTQLTLLIPGTTAPNLDSFTDGQRSTNTGGRPFVNGNREQANSFLLDGVDNNHNVSNVQSYEPNIDAIAEFKIITNNPSAEFGSSQGGIINVTMKSGTNEFHGTVFEFFRNDKLNANSWQRNYQGLDRVAVRHNVFGGTLGGRIIENRMFFFVDYQGVRRANPGTTGNFNVIPSEFRNGDFSRLLSEEKRQLYNPFSVTAAGVRTAFADNQIPVSLRNVVATNLFADTDLYPQPLNSGLRFNQSNTPTNHLNSDQGDVKVDYKLSPKDDLSVRYSKGRQNIPTTATFPLSYNSINEAPFQNGVVNWTRTFSPAVVNEFRAGVNRIGINDFEDEKGIGNVAEQLGIRNGNARGPGLLRLNFSGGFAGGLGSVNVGRARGNVSNNYQVSDNLTIIKGRHMMKTGFQWLRRQANNFFPGNFGTQGRMDFNGQFTTGPNANKPAARTGFAEADFFLGLPQMLALGVDGAGFGHRSAVIGAYFQDDWRIGDSLTLNLGLRWDHTSPFVEVANRQANFEPFTGKHLIAGQDGVSRALYESYYKDFQPRVGFAWTPRMLGGKTVLRGAYTISSYMEGMGANLRLPFNVPFMTEFSAIYNDVLLPPTRTQDGLTGFSSPSDPFAGTNPRLWDPFIQPARVQQWSFFIEQLLPAETVWSVGYVGQHGTHLVNVIEYSQKRMQPDGTVLPSEYLSGNPALKGISRIFGTETNANQRYDALQTSLRRRFNAGFEYQLSYTLSKTMADARGFFGTSGGQAGGMSARAQNIYDLKAEWGPAYYDSKHNFVFSGIYELPFGKGRKYGSGWHPGVNGLLGGWRISGIFLKRTGFAHTIQARDMSGTNSQGPRADRLADGEGPKQVGPGGKWIDTDAFRQPVRGTFGSSGVGVVRGPGATSLDASFQKDFPLDESKRFEFRADFFSITNTPIFGSFNQNVFAATFGEIGSAQGSREIQLGLKFYF